MKPQKAPVRRALSLLFLTACSGAQVPDGGTVADAGGDAGTNPGACDAGRFGLNDVSMLLPLSLDPVAVSSLVPRALYDRVVDNPQAFVPPQPFVFDRYPDLRVVAVRFDWCDRENLEPCVRGAPAVLRLVLQPVTNDLAADAALHAFFAVPASELPVLLEALDALAAEHPQLRAAPLQVVPASATFKTTLAALLTRYCSPATLKRLTFFAQPDVFAQVRWVFRGIEKHDAGFVDMTIPSASDGGLQHVFLGVNGYQATVLADVPAGFALSLDESGFGAASEANRLQALNALAEINDPVSRNVDTLQCVSCHVTTVLARLRADGGVLPPRFTSPYDLSTDGGESARRTGSLRAFGWLGDTPMISQRVVNESAHVLAESCR